MTFPTALLLSFLCGATFYSGLAQNPSSMSPQPYGFSLSFCEAMAEAQPDENLFFSPQAVKELLYLTKLAASGKTETEMQTALAAEPLVDYKAVTGLETANAIWSSSAFRVAPAFLKSISQQQSAAFKSINFKAPEKARKEINHWVSEHTQEQITELLPSGSIDGNTAMVLANALYFQRDWQVSFDESCTREGLFTMANGQPRSTTFMELVQRQAGALLYEEGAQYQSLWLPYAAESNERYGMLVVLPKEGVALAEVEQQFFQPAVFERCLSRLRPSPVRVQMPKFELQEEYRLTDVLRQLGIQEAFTTAADFSKITEAANDFYLSGVFHAAALKVSESGTEASAAGAAVLRSRSIQPQENLEEFKANHPFCFFIIDLGSNNILFSGRFVNP